MSSLSLYSAGHGETTLISTLLSIWALCDDPNIRIAIIAKNEQDARGIMRAIQAELLSNEKLIRDFGSFKPEGDDKAWSIERIDIAQRSKVLKEGSIQIYGSDPDTMVDSARAYVSALNKLLAREARRKPETMLAS